MNEPTENDILAAKVARKIKELQAQQEEIVEAIENYKSKLVELEGVTPEGVILGDAQSGFLKVTSYVHKAFNEAYGKKEHPDLWEKYAEEVKVLTSAIAKAKMPEEEYALFQKAGKVTVKVESLNND